MRIVLSGPPGAGKDTVAKALATHDGAVAIATEDLLRAAGTETSLAASAAMARGDLAADRLILGLVEEKLRECGDRGFILNGFPRSIPQAVSLDFILKRLGLTLDLVADLAVPAQVSLERLTNRRICTHPACRESYNLLFRPPAADGTCLSCGHPVAQDPEATEAAIAARLALYREKSSLLAGHYLRKGLLLVVEATDAQAAQARILAAVSAQARC